MFKIYDRERDSYFENCNCTTFDRAMAVLTTHHGVYIDPTLSHEAQNDMLRKVSPFVIIEFDEPIQLEPCELADRMVNFISELSDAGLVNLYNEIMHCSEAFFDGGDIFVRDEI